MPNAMSDDQPGSKRMEVGTAFAGQLFYDVLGKCTQPVQIGDLTKASYASAEAQQLSFLVDTLLFIVKQYEEEVTYKLLDGGNYAKFNVDVILRADYKNKISTLKEAVNGSIYMINEAREKCDLDTVEGGDVIICNGNAIPLQMIGQQYVKGGESEND